MTTSMHLLSSRPCEPAALADGMRRNFERVLAMTRQSLGLAAGAKGQSAPLACHSRKARSMSRSCSSQACSR